MFLSKRSNGIYYLWITDEYGKRKAVSTGSKTKNEALKFLQQFNAGEHSRRVKIKQTSLSQFSIDFLNYSQTIHTPKTKDCFAVAFREFIRIVGDSPLQKISIRDIEQFLSQKKGEASEWTARKYYTALSSAFETAKRWELLAENPFRKVEKPKTREIQPAYLSLPEFQMLLKAVTNRDLSELYLTAVCTGMRLNELASLQWTDIDFVQKVIFIQNSATFTTKSKKNRIVPMSEHLWQMLVVRKENAGSELVFHLKGRKLKAGYISKNLKKVIRKVGLSEKLHFHSLRHTFASWLVQKGVNLYEVQKLLGHSSIAVTEIYAHLQPEQLHSTVNKITFALN